jgi:hypothetical protein
VPCAVVVLTCFVMCGCVCGFCNVWVRVCVGFIVCGFYNVWVCVCVGFVMCDVCLCVGFVMRGVCVCVWVL